MGRTHSSRSGTQANSASTRVHRINVNFSEGAYAVLVVLAEESGKTMAEVLRDALALEKWFHDERRAGNRVLVERDGHVREVIPR